MRLSILVLSCLVPLAACNLYFAGGEDPCEEWGGDRAGAMEAADLLRNPETGECEAFGGWGGGCDDECGPCPGFEDSLEQAPYPSWGYCESSCTGLDEQGCLATSGCRGIYAPGAPDAPEEFRECWQVDQSGGTIDDCENLDGWSCSTSDTCIAVHQFDCDADSAGDRAPGFEACPPGPFLQCHNEPTETDSCDSNDDCDAGWACNIDEVCPQADECEPEVCGTPEPCHGSCVPVEQSACQELLTEDVCISRDDCSPFYLGNDCSCDDTGCSCSEWLFSSCG